MKQKMFKLLVVFEMFLVSSCSSEQPKILGKWQGEVVQPNFGTIDLKIELNNLEMDKSAGRLISKVIDITNCDPEQFECEIGACEADWIFKGNKGENFLFLEKQLEGSACGDGNIAAKISKEDRLEFTWTDVTEPTNQSSGSLTRQ